MTAFETQLTMSARPRRLIDVVRRCRFSVERQHSCYSWSIRPSVHPSLPASSLPLYGNRPSYSVPCVCMIWHKCSAVAKMGDRLVTVDMGRKLGDKPLWGGELGPHLTQCGQGPGLPACQVSSWSIQPFGHNTPTLQTDRTGRGQTGQSETTVRYDRANRFT